MEIPRVNTIADGLAVKKPGEGTFGLVRRWVDEIVLVSDREIASAILLLLERTKLLVEPAGAAPVAALLSGRTGLRGCQVVAVVSGGNVDLPTLKGLITTAGEGAGG